MSLSARIAVVGSINMDLAVRTPRMPTRGENLMAHRWQLGLGGKGSNASVALSRMGTRALLVGAVGSDAFGRQAIETLSHEGVTTDAIVIAEDVDTGIALIMVDDGGENTILVVAGANHTLTPQAVRKALEPHWSALDALLVNFEIPEACVAEAVAGCRTHDVLCIVDAGPPRHFGRETWGGCTVLSPNALEASTLVGYDLVDDTLAVRAARDLLAAGPQAIVMKRGARGALLCTRDETVMVSAFEVEVVDTTGAGDAFTAALSLGLAEGLPLTEATRLGCAAGALAVTRLGTMNAMPTREEIEHLMQRQRHG